MDTGETVDPSSDANISQAAVAYNDVVKDNKTKTNLLNRIKYYLTSLYPVSFKGLRCRGTGDSRLIVATFKFLEENQEFNALLASDHVGLKVNDDSFSPRFHEFNTRAVNAEENSRSIIITDIPLFFKSDEIRAALSKFGTIQKFSLRTPPLSKFQKATVVFTDIAMVNR